MALITSRMRVGRFCYRHNSEDRTTIEFLARRLVKTIIRPRGNRSAGESAHDDLNGELIEG
jgi:hypothetical protein